MCQAEYSEIIGDTSVGDELLCPIDQIVIPLSFRTGSDGQDIAACIRFSDGRSHDSLSAGQGWEIFLLLFLGTVGLDELGAKSGQQNISTSGIDPPEFLHHHGKFKKTQSQAFILFFEKKSDET